MTPFEPWADPPDGVLAGLRSSPTGLAPAEAEKRLLEIGPNELPEEEATSAAAIALRQFRSPLIYILLGAGVMTIALGQYLDAGVIGAVLALNAVVGFLQEHGAERSMAVLRQLTSARARVLRDAREREVDVRELVPGDVVLVEAGGRVPADCRIVHEVGLEVDESHLTGESETVAKDSAALDPETALPERANMLFMGSAATLGRGSAVVVATGAETELGRIAGSLGEIEAVETPLQRRIARLARVIGVAVLVAGLAGFALGALAGEDLDELFFAVVALAVSAIPEGLPIVLTVALAISVRRMAARRAIVRRLPAVETLGSCTVIASDKTGTLTQNRMTVERIVTGGERFEVTGSGYSSEGGFLLGGEPVDPAEGSSLALTLLAGALCNDASVVLGDGEFKVRGDPTEIGLLVAAAKAGMFRDELEEDLPRWGEIPFDPTRRFAATFHRDGRRDVVFVKGAPERIVEMCGAAVGPPALDREAILLEARALAANGLRVIALATRQLPETGAESLHDHLAGLTFLGLEAMIDPPREEAGEAVRRCREAGIRPLMVTGDHAVTALAIARELGIAGERDRVLGGAELEALDDEELRDAVAETSVFARVAPEHKLRIVEALRAGDEVVAVTGDGVNDAPALKAADIGAAMGRSGTDVAKEAADMVIADDDFATVFAAVEEGRIAFANVRNTTFFLISCGAAEVLAVLASLLFGFPLPLLPAQLLWLNLVTNGIEDIGLAFEPGEEEVRRRPPRPREEEVISPLLWERTALVGVVMAAGTLLLFLLERSAGAPLEEARTVALTALVLFQVVHVGNCRSERRSLFTKPVASNPLLFFGTGAALAVHVGALYFGPTQAALRLVPLDPWAWAEIGAVSLTVAVAVEAHKLWRRAWEQRA
jgi:magnesium-transporting ATPase (P-type)